MSEIVPGILPFFVSTFHIAYAMSLMEHTSIAWEARIPPRQLLCTTIVTDIAYIFAFNCVFVVQVVRLRAILLAVWTLGIPFTSCTL
jgi:hypothetical protein